MLDRYQKIVEIENTTGINVHGQQVQRLCLSTGRVTKRAPEGAHYRCKGYWLHSNEMEIY